MRSSIIHWKFGWVLLFFFLCISLFLDKSSKQKEVEKLMKEWYGKEIFFPKGMIATIMGDSSIIYSDLDYVNRKRKVVFYADSLECVNCDLNLLEWLDFMEMADSVTCQGISYLFYFSPKREKEIISTLRMERFNVPVFIDYERKFEKLNRLPNNQLFRTFLLDENNKIILIGNPTHGMEELYLKVLSK